MQQDREHLRLLSVFHYVMAGLACLLPLLSLIYIGMGVMMLRGQFGAMGAHGAHAAPAPSPPQFAGWFLIGFGALFACVGMAGAILNFLAARSLARHERRTLCFVVAGLNCLHMPLGTALGVFTLVVLQRPTVVALFAEAAARRAPERVGGAVPAPAPHPGAVGSPFADR